jgi:hypothetical protein
MKILKKVHETHAHFCAISKIRNQQNSLIENTTKESETNAHLHFHQKQAGNTLIKSKNV